MMKVNWLVGLLVSLLVGAATASEFVAWDPSRHAPNARVLGLGRAYVALADDAGAVYVNPAGLAERDRWQLATMSGRFLEEYLYYSATGYYPLPLGAVGLGFAGSAIYGANVTRVKEGSDPADPIYEIDYSQPPVSNTSNVFLLSYGSRLGDWLRQFKLKIDQLEKIDLGVSLKLFSAGLVGDGIINGTGTGVELDLGLQYQTPFPWLKAGASLQNALPFALGGKLRYANGHEETYPALLSGGLAVKLMGPKGALRTAPQAVTLVYDIDYQPTLAGYPLIHHAGLEWQVAPVLALRAGLDQDIGGDISTGLTTISNLTAGAGLNYGGFQFDYAYMELKSAPGIINHYFSLGFSPPERTRIAAKDYLRVNQPPDKLITFDPKILVAAQALEPEAKRVYINKNEIRLGGQVSFEAEIPLNFGKNKILVEAYGEKGRIGEIFEAETIRILRLAGFFDVAPDYWAAKPISLLAMAKVVAGYPGGDFRPEGNITRAEMCSLLMKTKVTGNEERVTSFADVPETHWAAKFIADAAAAGIVKGYPGNLFKPGGRITRAEGIAMVARFAGLSEEAYENEFSDLPSTHWSARLAAGASKAGLLDFLKGKRFEADKPLTRAETVSMLYATGVVRGLLGKDLLNWELY